MINDKKAELKQSIKLYKEDVRRAEDCADLFIEHFGPVCAIENDKTMKLIYIRIVDCLLTMVMDYGI